jgi:hypothetical protein
MNNPVDFKAIQAAQKRIRRQMKANNPEGYGAFIRIRQPAKKGR